MSYVDRLLAPGETILYRSLRHWIVLLRWIAGALALAVLGGLMIVLYGWASWAGASAGAWFGAGLVTLAVLFALPAMLRYASEVYVVTDRRVLRVDGVFRKQALDSGLAKINDVHLTQSVAGRLLGYGTLEIITASDVGINRFEYLPRPMAFKKAMMSAVEARAAGVHDEARSTVASAPPASAPRATADRLAELEDLRKRGLVAEDEYRVKRKQILDGL
jgi:uncharacterized membrane protein YdbT with pleckstrin-like domain